jgi:hypothetical protein
MTRNQIIGHMQDSLCVTIQKLFHQHHLRVASISRDCKTVNTLLAAAFQYTVEQLVHLFSLCLPSPSESHKNVILNRASAVESAQLLGLGMFVDRRPPSSSRHHESGVWQGLYRLEVEVVLDSTRCNGKLGRCNGRKTRSCKRDYSDVSSIDSSSVIWKITREYLNL